MSPNGQTSSPEAKALRNLVGGTQALRSVMANLERKAASVIWKASPEQLEKVTKCVMEAASIWRHWTNAKARASAVKNPDPDRERPELPGRYARRV